MAKNTTALLQRLRGLMKNAEYVCPAVHAYIVPSGDAHLSEYIADCDERRAFITGFTGSTGTAIVTETKAAMWTDGRYFLQARSQMDDNWLMMSLVDTPSQADWLCKELPSNGRVGVDPYLFSAGSWHSLRKQLVANGHTLVAIERNLIDVVWDTRPPVPHNTVFVHPLHFAGKAFSDKVKDVQSKMEESQTVGLVLSALDEIAWLLNLRGSDIAFNPVFFAYVIVTRDSVLLFIDKEKLSEEVYQHLSSGHVNVKVLPYGDILTHLREFVASTSGKIWLSDNTNFALFDSVPKPRRYAKPSPVAVLKCLKNDVEIEGMKQAHIKDAVALCQFFTWLEKEVPGGNVDELSAAECAEKFRKQQQDYVSLSFSTISAVGSNAAIIHYRPAEETNKKLDLSQIFLLDSGAQYRDGTTDITRTVHLGTPSDHEKECFTRVLKGHIALARTIFPNGVKGFLLDTLARSSLWEIGLDYQHGTGHGVGSFLNVHEGPCGIGYRVRTDDIPLQQGMILSDEPGYYEDDNFGIRIESLLLVKNASPKFNFKDKGFLTFEPITWVPLQTKLIVKDLLTVDEIAWLNEYHVKCREIVGPELQKLQQHEAFEWLLKETQQL